VLYRLVFVSDAAGPAAQSTQSIAEILGASASNNRRDEITGVMLFHRGQIAQIVEGARHDLDRLMSRLSRDARHRRMTVLVDRPVVQRRHHHAMRLCDLADRTVETTTGGRRLSDLSGAEIEALLSACDMPQASAA